MGPEGGAVSGTEPAVCGDKPTEDAASTGLDLAGLSGGFGGFE